MPSALHTDYHVHTNYSDGDFLEFMVRAAEAAGLEAVGLADHCILPVDGRAESHRDVAGYNLDVTYERRRRAIEIVRQQYDLTIHDAVEVDYFPGAEDRIASFLESADFEYAIGSIHVVGDENVHHAAPFRDRSRAERRALVEDYFDRLVRLIESELFEVAAHVDIIERNEALRGLADVSQYRRVAEAFADSRTIPELNAGRIDASYGRFHPRESFLEVLLDRGIDITVGSDSHRPADLDRRIPALRTAFETHALAPSDPLAG
ncbi:MAG: PHP domain-containing protein [Halobacteriales archaeon]